MTGHPPRPWLYTRRLTADRRAVCGHCEATWPCPAARAAHSCAASPFCTTPGRCGYLDYMRASAAIELATVRPRRSVHLAAPPVGPVQHCAACGRVLAVAGARPTAQPLDRTGPPDWFPTGGQIAEINGGGLILNPPGRELYAPETLCAGYA